jgi:hypothetical protein
MNEEDKKNLKFIMESSSKDFDAWMEEASAEDISYALELIHTSKAELMVEQIELQELAIVDDEDIGEAKHILDRIRNVGITRKNR